MPPVGLGDRVVLHVTIVGNSSTKYLLSGGRLREGLRNDVTKNDAGNEVAAGWLDRHVNLSHLLPYTTFVVTHTNSSAKAVVSFRGCELPLGHFFSVTPP